MKKSIILFMFIIMLFCGCGNKNVEQTKTISLSFDANPTTGYNWSYVIEDESIVKIINDEYIPDNVDKGICGAGGKQNYTLEAVGEGSTTVIFKYSRSWDEEAITIVKKQICVDNNNNITVIE